MSRGAHGQNAFVSRHEIVRMLLPLGTKQTVEILRVLNHVTCNLVSHWMTWLGVTDGWGVQIQGNTPRCFWLISNI